MNINDDKTNVGVGTVFNRLTVISEAPKQRGSKYWVCRCICGKEKTVRERHLTHGHTMSCGCLFSERLADRNRTHGKSTTTIYRLWANLPQRCGNPNNPAFKYYGGRGITVCDRWVNSFENFVADMGEPPPGATLDRVDNNKGYSPDNCRWASREDQANNMRSNRLITLRGVTMTTIQWARRLGLNPGNVYSRLHRGWTPERALT